MSNVEHQTEEELVDYTEEENTQNNTSTGEGVQKTGNYVAIHASGFRDFYLKPELLRAIGDAGFEHPSEVQHEAIPQAITGTDILCQAKSGLGKTAVFVISTLQQMDFSEAACTCLVLAHTRELAYQIKNEYDRFSQHIEGARISVCYGGVPQEKDEALVSNPETVPHILIGTPGRVLALVKSKKLNLSKLRHFVVDECDKVLEKQDMRNDVNVIFMDAPKQIQVMMLSATLSPEIREVCKKFMDKPLEIFVDDEGKLTLHGLLQHYVELEEKEKTRKLMSILDNQEFNQAIIFVKSPARAKALNGLLNENKFPSICVHGQMKQAERIQKYKEFKNFEKRIMVATDLFGRGIDIERINIVINYDMPENADSYLHRVGRAGRFGTKGLAVTFCASEEDKAVLESVQSRFEVKVTPMPAQIETASYINA
eukprot:GDKJ01029591.1.p1 GENE.GDKJ01029591.1~~GDKJ01029591.1.p1  ORF type:complete len:427 (+),score=114.80 GDKJ01029591.1:37-1317(+)